MSTDDELRERYRIEAAKAYARGYWPKYDEALLKAFLEHAEPMRAP